MVLILGTIACSGGPEPNSLLLAKKQPVSFCLETKPDGKIQVLALCVLDSSCKKGQSPAKLDSFNAASIKTALRQSSVLWDCSFYEQTDPGQSRGTDSCRSYLV